MYQRYYSRFLAAHQNVLHMAAHSHHFWPDVTREAQIQYWDDSCRMADEKWSYFFTTQVPRTQHHIAKTLNISSPEQIVFAANTHEFVMRLYSCFDLTKKLVVLTTDSEFYSFERQTQRLAESSQLEIIKVPTEPFATFAERFVAASKKHQPQFIFLSHVFFNSGWMCPLDQILPQLSPDTVKVVDAYHSFMAVPFDWSPFEKDIFYLSGSYKYAQGGEGCCFLYVPPKSPLRPAYTGWFAELSNLASKTNEVFYPENGLRFAGSTLDFTSLYRLNAVYDLFEKDQVTLKDQHQFVQSLQKSFLKRLEQSPLLMHLRDRLIFQNWEEQGHFLTFELSSVEETISLVQSLKKQGIWTDSRKNRIRFGFGLYLTEKDFDRWIK
jgi:selenocysteine lyase/cysteine desulfurase